MNQARCAHCGNDLTPNTPEEEAEMLAELRELFGDIPLSECVIVCDDCFQKMRPQDNPLQYDRYLDAHEHIKGVREIVRQREPLTLSPDAREMFWKLYDETLDAMVEKYLKG